MTMQHREHHKFPLPASAIAVAIGTYVVNEALPDWMSSRGRRIATTTTLVSASSLAISWLVMKSFVENPIALAASEEDFQSAAPLSEETRHEAEELFDRAGLGTPNLVERLATLKDEMVDTFGVEGIAQVITSFTVAAGGIAIASRVAAAPVTALLRRCKVSKPYTVVAAADLAALLWFLRNGGREEIFTVPVVISSTTEGVPTR